MHRRSILKWTSLTAISILITLLLSGFLHHDSAWAAASKAAVQTSGALQVLDQTGKPAGECPLKHTAVKAEVSGFLSRVTVTQEFENPFPDKIEAVYVFPLPQSAAVDDLTMLIGERAIRGKIMRREEAQAAYTAAKQLGQVATLLDQERPNIFTQSVANIMPGQQIRITISYVETLKYEDGSYEWSFPMVVGPRYIPASNQQPEPNNEMKAENVAVPDASRITPPDATNGMRAGHDISLEIALDAGVPIESLNSETHETEVERTGGNRATVRLRDRAAIPNKDFVLKYQVAGATINDAVLAHRSDRGGFFTLILQPPQRVTAEDVMPKELVFVLDTSGSMFGFPFEKARETMLLALDNLYPHDTFNLITFSGDTRILFSEPVPATPENLSKAKKFLASHESSGGTEMMKAIKAALEPSDSQQHLRITCFMTDGQVGNDLGIISEVQKHPNARVFAMGFGRAPNRFLLDKMAEYGRGEVDYVSESGDTSAVARRFNERIRNPLLSDVSIDWSGLPVTEVYPKHVPDLFSAKPVILSGRYAKGGTGTITLRGRMAGQDFVREIAVQLPETEEGHDVLATLWARRKIDDLMGQDMEGLQRGTMKDGPREEITQLGLNFRLMTQFTSFVAVDEGFFTGGDEPRRIDVPVESMSALNASYGVSALVDVTSGTQTLNTTASSLSANITPRSIEDLPVQGRGLFTLILLAPGTFSAPSDQFAVPSQFNISSNGQRSIANSFVVDGVSANFGIAAGGQGPGASAAGTGPALTASGGTNGIVSRAAIAEVVIDTSYTQPEYGRVPGAQVNLTTRSGTNDFHGSLFHFFGNDLFDANDWFANSRALPKPARRLNNFGGTFGGPVAKDKAFFFASYEGLRLRQPMTGITDTPSLSFRATAPSEVRALLEAFPTPNGDPRPDGFAEFAATFANPARHDVGSIRFDVLPNNASAITGRYSFADSEATQRGAGGFSLNTTSRIRSRAQTITGSLTQTLSPRMVVELRANYSRLRVNGSYLLDDFGGAVAPSAFLFPTPNQSYVFDLNGRNASWMTGDGVSNVQRQVNVVASTAIISGEHSFKFGADYRRLSPIIALRAFEEGALFDGVAQALTGVAARINSFHHSGPQMPVFSNLSLYGQDEWRQSSRLTLTYGMRWELNPPPTPTGDPRPPAVDQIRDLAHLMFAAPGTPLWKTTYANFAPRFGFAYQLSKTSDRELLVRGGVGILYDLGQDRAGNAFADSVPFISGASLFNAPFPADLSSLSTTGNLPLLVFDPQLKLPYTLHWNVSVQRALGESQAISAAYIGSRGRRLLHTQTLFDLNPEFALLRLTTNRARSDYRSVQIQFDRRLANGLASLVSYTWSRSSDNASQDSTRGVFITSLNPDLDRGPSDFDVRYQLTGLVSYELPAPLSTGIGNTLFRNWAFDSVFKANAARPVNVVSLFPTSFGFAYPRPDLVAGVPLYLLDSAAGGGRRINAAAFLAPEGLQQGNLGRNSLRGFPLYQIDLALRRRFHFSEFVSLQLQVEAFNLFNHPNFEDSLGSDLVVGSKFDPASAIRPNATFGQSASFRGQSVLGGGAGGFGSFYDAGGARTLQFSVKLTF